MAYNTSEKEFLAKDGTKIFYRSFLPKDSATKRAIVVQHGFGEHSGRYKNLVNALEGTGFSIYALDSRGHGKSPGKRGAIDHFHLFLDDLDSLIEIAKKESGKEQVILLGHSMGSNIVASYLEEGTNQKKLKAAVLSAIPFRVKKDLMMEVKGFAGSVLAKLTPNLTIPAGLDANGLSHDTNVVEAYIKDPLVHGMISCYLGDLLLNLEEPILANAEKIHLPIYFFHGKLDAIADYTASEDMFAKVSSKDKTIKVYDGLFHETMNEKEPAKTQVLNDLKQWLLKQI